jgi:benzoate-CoA ligase
VQPEERVLIICQDRPEFVAAFLGALAIGAVPVPLSTLFTPADYRYFIGDSRARALVIEGALLEKVLDARDKDPPFKTVLAVDPTEETRGVLSYHDVVSRQPTTLPFQETHRDDPCYWLYSSGTTGRPKGVVHLHGDMVHCIEPFARHVVDIGPEDVVFCVPKLSFSYGLGTSLFLSLMAGASSVLLPRRPEPALVLEALERYRPTLFFAVPTFYAALLRELEARENGAGLDSLRLCVSAGEVLPAPLYRRWVERTGVELIDALGSTEVGYVFISNIPGRVKPGSSGLLLPGFGARILDEESREVAPGEPGDLYIKASSTALYYWRQRDRTKEVMQGEWTGTGDRYRRDADGYYFHLGRSDDMIRASGFWVSPVEVEEALLEHPGVAECAVVGEADAQGLYKPKAFVVPGDGYGPGNGQLARELQNWVKERLAPYKYPRAIAFVPELPHTVTGKIQRFRLRTAPPTAPISRPGA